LSCESQHGAEILHTFYKQHEDGKQQLSTEALRKCLVSLLSTIGYVRIVLDALDESTTQPQLLTWIQSLGQSRLDHVQLLATSRKERRFESDLVGFIRPDAIVPIQDKAVNTDIHAYVKKRVDTDKDFERWRETTYRQNIENVKVLR